MRRSSRKTAALWLYAIAVTSLAIQVISHLWMIALIIGVPAGVIIGYYMGRQSASVSVRHSPERTDAIPADDRSNVRRLLSDPRSGARPTKRER